MAIVSILLQPTTSLTVQPEDIPHTQIKSSRHMYVLACSVMGFRVQSLCEMADMSAPYRWPVQECLQLGVRQLKST